MGLSNFSLEYKKHIKKLGGFMDIYEYVSKRPGFFQVSIVKSKHQSRVCLTNTARG